MIANANIYWLSLRMPEKIIRLSSMVSLIAYLKAVTQQTEVYYNHKKSSASRVFQRSQSVKNIDLQTALAVKNSFNNLFP